jgi:ABC-type branched-subunit amino acid transport system substrate-binding protein
VRARALVAALALALPCACSLVLETSPSQCSSDGDCYARGGEFATSVCVSGRCVAPTTEGGPAGGCTTNRECTDKLVAPAICRARDHVCVRLLSPECSRITGDVLDDGVILFGALNSTTGTNGPSGLARQSSAELALNEIKVSVSGIRPSPDGTPRPLALVECDDTVDSVVPAQHLVDDLDVPAILGVASSSRVIEVATKVTIPKGVLLLTAAATSPAITSLPDKNLLWRTSPSDALQSLAIVDQLPALEAKYRADNAVPAATKIRIAFVYIDEAYGLGLYEAVTRAGQLNGKPIGDPANAGLTTALSYPADPADLEAVITKILGQSQRPNIIVGFGSTEVITKFLTPLESRWGAAPRPVYLFADAAQKTELLDAVAADNGLRKRIRGSVPAAPRTSDNFKSFVFKYEGAFGGPAPSVFGMAGTYDGLFLLAYAVAAAGTRPLTGDELQKGFARLVSGALVDVGGSSLNTGFQALASPAGTFDFDGASGPLDFDLATGEARSNIDVWCIKKDGTGRPAFLPSGRLYDAKASKMNGVYSTTACQGGATD